MNSSSIHLLIGNPSYDGTVHNLHSHISALTQSRIPTSVKHMTFTSSILTLNFNTLWCTALNLRSQGEITHFLLWHADVKPHQPDWLDILLNEMIRTDVDVLATSIPIKDKRGLTSTAIDTDKWNPIRLTQSQILDMPETWSMPNLLVNTGLLLIDMRHPWTEQICFTMNDRITQDANGMFRASVEPEDWNFSRQCHSLGTKLAVTRKVTVDHYGTNAWSSDEAWGQDADYQTASSFEFSYEEI